MPVLHHLHLEPLVKRAIEEDWGGGDWTTDICVPEEKRASAAIVSKQDQLVVAGLDVAKKVFEIVDPSLGVELKAREGEVVGKKAILLEVCGNARSILKAERVVLNFMMRMSAIATTTRSYVQELEGSQTQLLDTRKTTPCLRLIEKAATVIGGARNHRMSLTDGVMVKENHIRASGSITNAVNKLKESLPPTLKVEVETSNLEEVREALAAGADLIMLDNMDNAMMTEAVALIDGKALVEASGNVTLERLKGIAQTGVDFVSTSAILHSTKGVDISLLFTLES